MAFVFGGLPRGFFSFTS